MTPTTVHILVDTNVILYSLDPTNPAKQQRCQAWLKAATGARSIVVSPQVCSETRLNAEKKLRLTPRIAREAAEALLPWCTAPAGSDEVRAALAIEARWKLSWWDALLLASAVAARCTHLLTEDRQRAPVIEGVRIVDPFATTPDAVLRAD
jgi:predicted nucleic acid-binding protein